jgi:hypothetical protein
VTCVLAGCGSPVSSAPSASGNGSSLNLTNQAAPRTTTEITGCPATTSSPKTLFSLTEQSQEGSTSESKMHVLTAVNAAGKTLRHVSFLALDQNYNQLPTPTSIVVTNQAVYQIRNTGDSKSLIAEKYALTNGKLLWRKTINAGSQSFGSKPYTLSVDHSIVYIHIPKSVEALSGSNGKQLWTYSFPAAGNMNVTIMGMDLG